MMRIGESASNNLVAGTKYQEHFKKIIIGKVYLPHQISNLDGTVLKF